MPILNEIIPISAFQDNYIWLFFDADSRNAHIIDPGDAVPVLKTLEKKQFSLSSILLTHHHHDHSGGVIELLNIFPQVKVYGSHLSKLPFITHHLKENDIIHCSNRSFKAIEIPGHTLDHNAYYGEGWLFSGDTLFSAGCGRVFEGTHEMMFQSLQKLKQLPNETKVFCGHEYTLANLAFAQQVEPNNNAIREQINIISEFRKENQPSLPSTIYYEKKFNPFFRLNDETIKRSAEKYAGKSLNSPVEVFSVLREWKNGFVPQTHDF